MKRSSPTHGTLRIKSAELPALAAKDFRMKLNGQADRGGEIQLAKGDILRWQ